MSFFKKFNIYKRISFSVFRVMSESEDSENILRSSLSKPINILKFTRTHESPGHIPVNNLFDQDTSLSSEGSYLDMYEINTDSTVDKLVVLPILREIHWF